MSASVNLRLLHWIVLLMIAGSQPQTVLSQNITAVRFPDILPSDIKTGCQRTEIYFPWLREKKVAVIANQTSMLGGVHLVDTLVAGGIQVVKVFCPEHGFRGQAEAGEVVETSRDSKTGLPVISLYGKKKKPSAADLADIDVVLFDIQDVGARFYTYISTLSYAMEACAENGKTMIVLDRPNPNGHYIDGPVLEPSCSSFIGLHPVPVVHGMTMAEYACMVNGEKWLKNGIQCKLMLVPVLNYNHNMLYQLPVKPSPNLASMEAIYLYPSLCLFEGTCISVGRGTTTPFEIIGHPLLDSTTFSFTPASIPGMAKNPPYQGQLCHGYNLTAYAREYLKYACKLNLFPLLECYKLLKDKTEYFNATFNRLAGNETLKQQIIQGKGEEEIRRSWEDGLKIFRTTRKKYLLYTDFE